MAERHAGTFPGDQFESCIVYLAYMRFMVPLTRRRLLKRAVHFGMMPLVMRKPQRASGVALTHEMGIGGVTASSAWYRARAQGEATVSIEYSTSSDLSGGARTPGVAVTADTDFTGGEEITGLLPNTRYYYCIRIDGARVQTAPFAEFRTFPVEGVDAEVVIAAGSCQLSPTEPIIFASIAAEAPAVFIHAGDLHYGDITTIVGQRAHYQAQYASDFLTQIVRRLPRAHIWSDHDYGGNNEDGGMRGKANSLQAFKEYIPTYPLVNPASGVWQSFRIANGEVFMLDTRYNRQASGPRYPEPPASTLVVQNGSSGTEVVVLDGINGPHRHFANAYVGFYVQIDNFTYVRRVLSSIYDPTSDTHRLTLDSAVPGLRSGETTCHLRRKSMLDQDLLGADGQTEWLINGLNRSTAKWKVVVTDVVWNTTCVGGGDVWSDWDTDRMEQRYIIERVKAPNVLVISGDRHRSAIDDGTNSVWPEMSASPLNQSAASMTGKWTNGVTTAGTHYYGVLTLGSTYATMTIKNADGTTASSVKPLPILAA